MRRQIFRQTSQNDEVEINFRQGVLVQYDGKGASSCVVKATAVNCAVLPYKKAHTYSMYRLLTNRIYKTTVCQKTQSRYSTFSLQEKGAKKKLTKRNAVREISTSAEVEEGYAPSTAPPFEKGGRKPFPNWRNPVALAKTQTARSRGIEPFFVCLFLLVL